MRLINVNTKVLQEFTPDCVPKYAILSHTWRKDEVLFTDFKMGAAGKKPGSQKAKAGRKTGYQKIMYTCDQAQKDGLDYAWVDTCCIDKNSSADLSESINSMFRWYQESEVCYVYLDDVNVEGSTGAPSSTSRGKEQLSEKLHGARWFTRGWTLQELLAPTEVAFFDSTWHKLGSKSTLSGIISDVTRIDEQILLQQEALESASVAKRMSWAAGRQTSMPEDIAYCLLGIFQVHMPLIYGERENAFVRLQEQIMRTVDDHSLFGWIDPSLSPEDQIGLLARSPAQFFESREVVSFQNWSLQTSFSMSNSGISISAPVSDLEEGLYGADLNCCWAPGSPPVRLVLKPVSQEASQYIRVRANEQVAAGDGSGKLRTVCVRNKLLEPQSFDILPTYGFLPEAQGGMSGRYDYLGCLGRHSSHMMSTSSGRVVACGSTVKLLAAWKCARTDEVLCISMDGSPTTKFKVDVACVNVSWPSGNTEEDRDAILEDIRDRSFGQGTPSGSLDTTIKCEDHTVTLRMKRDRSMKVLWAEFGPSYMRELGSTAYRRPGAGEFEGQYTPNNKGKNTLFSEGISVFTRVTSWLTKESF